MFVGLRAENENAAKDMMQTYTGALAQLKRHSRCSPIESVRRDIWILYEGDERTGFNHE